jgi:predicted ATPase
MDGKRLIRRLALRNFLSYGSEGAEIELLPLNVLIGPNASGKSNFIEALATLRATATDLPRHLREGGGVGEYVYRSGDGSATIQAEVEHTFGPSPLHYGLTFAAELSRPVVTEEWIASQATDFYRLKGRQAVIAQRQLPAGPTASEYTVREIPGKDLLSDQSILAQRRDPDSYPELTYLSIQFFRIAIFQDWMFGRFARARAPQPTDLPTDFLLPDASNLALVLHEMQQRSAIEEKIIGYLQRFYEPVQRVRIRIQGGTVQLFIDEGLDEFVPAARLSDGTLHYLSLLAILLHPSPPPLVCIEEPELGLHPDILPTIAELLLDASQRTQLVVTTHSDALVSALSEVPEAVVVCEPSVKGSQLRRLDREALAEWLHQYSLGELWRIGGIGGNRW